MKRVARAKRVDSWITSVPINEIRPKIQNFFTMHGVNIDQINDGEIIGKQGSQLITRLLGGWFVNQAKFPKRIFDQLQNHLKTV